MADAIAVLNAGSSSFKFSLFARGAQGIALVARGQAEGLYTSPRFVAKDGTGATIDEKSWGEGVSLGHAGALDHLVAFLRQRLDRAPARRRGPPGRARRTRVRRSPCASMRRCSRRSRSTSRSRRCTSRTTWRRSGRCSSGCRSCRRSPASIPRSTAASRRSRRRSRCPKAITERGVHPLRLPRPVVRVRRQASCRSTTRAPPPARSSCCISATARACARSQAAAASRARWASPPSTGCRWAPAAETSIRAWCCT